MVSKETNLQVDGSSPGPGVEEKQRRRMLAALVLLLIALIVVLIKDREFWFSSSQPSEPVATEQQASPPTPTASSQSVPVVPVQTAPTAQPAQPTTKAKSKKTKGKTPNVQTAISADNSQAGAGPVITATNRTVLPPLEVEVVAGNQHRALSPNNNSVKVDMESSSSSALPAAAVSQDQGRAPTVPDASPQVTLPPATAERVTRSVKPDYPVLAKQMKVQGAVVLQALIDKAGRIQELHVVSGPAILATAAQEAVKQWRFKPYYQQGQAVETEARITVNFTISTY
ncbi:MAG TPA: energy transducer TonB [Terriglobales bacterium]|nr:energy transducer TonB [Terriglobales bacterium]